MKKRLIAILMALVAAICFVGCDSGDDPTASSGQALSKSAQLFLRLVSEIDEEIGLDSEADIDAPLIVYEHLSEEERSLPAIEEKKTLLDGFKAQFDELVAKAEREALQRAEDARIESFLSAVRALPEEEALTFDDREGIEGAKALYEALSDVSKSLENVVSAHERLSALDDTLTRMEREAHDELVKEQAEAFLAAVSELGKVTLDSGESIAALLGDYDAFEDDIKAYEGVADAKATLDRMMDEYHVLNFLARVKEIGQVSLASIGKIESAFLAYEPLSDSAGQSAEVVDAYNTLQQAKARYDELFAIEEQKRVALFLEKVALIPDDISTLDITWFDRLNDASLAYAALSSETQEENEDVKAAFEKWNAAQKLFDERGYQQIPISTAWLDFSTDDPRFLLIHTFQNDNGRDYLATTKNFYHVTSAAQLAEHVNFCLDVYVDGEFVVTTTFGIGAIDGFIVRNVPALLSPLEAEHPAVKSGANFSFTFHFEDKNGEFIPSARTPRSIDVTYTW